LLQNMQFDVIIANINRNILLNDMPAYVLCLKQGGELYLSGFYSQDVPILEAKAESLGLKLIHSKQKNNWTVMKLVWK